MSRPRILYAVKILYCIQANMQHEMLNIDCVKICTKNEIDEKKLLFSKTNIGVAVRIPMMENLNFFEHSTFFSHTWQYTNIPSVVNVPDYSFIQP